MQRYAPGPALFFHMKPHLSSVFSRIASSPPPPPPDSDPLIDPIDRLTGWSSGGSERKVMSMKREGGRRKCDPRGV